MSKYGWKITKDLINDGEDNGMYGPGNISQDWKTKLDNNQGERQRLYDDDDELYYEALLIGNTEGFEVLDDFAMPNAGCTYVRYYNPKTKTWDYL